MLEKLWKIHLNIGKNCIFVAYGLEYGMFLWLTLQNTIVLMNTEIKNATKNLKGYFNALPDKEKEEETIAAITHSVSFHGANLWVLIFAILIASLGLNVNSTAVIIGAMLISPLMGPIIGMGLAVGINDLDLLKQSAKNYLVATLISVVTASAYFLITPLTEAQSELLARTSPTLYDVLIALAGGAAGILALATKGKGNVIPGVAIATALMPPLCTAGFGIATGNLSYFFGAFYLFFINTVFICLATFVGVRLLQFKRKVFINRSTYVKVRKYIFIIVILTMLPAAYMTTNIIRESIFQSNVQSFIKEELSFRGTQIISHTADEDSHTLKIVAVGKEITNSMIDKAQKSLGNYRLNGYKLLVIQGVQSDSILSLNDKLNNLANNHPNSSQQLLEQSQYIHALEKELANYRRYENLGNEIRGELKVLFPSVQTISIAHMTEARTDTTSTKSFVLAIVGVKRESC